MGDVYRISPQYLNIALQADCDYLFTAKSTVFHRRGCRSLLIASGVYGSDSFSACIASGRRPCKLCNPDSAETRRDGAASDVTSQRSNAVNKAIKRHRQAMAERTAIENNLHRSSARKDDLCRLSTTSYAFFAAKGYRTFHLRNCCRISNIQNLEGFSLYADACRAGYMPCKRCKPTDKHNITVSLPIYTRQREEETIGQVIRFCKQNGYDYSEENNFCYIKTGAGIWRLDISQSPYRLEHFNRIKQDEGQPQFHEQGKLFLSITDAVYYIKRHDDGLQFVWNGSEYVPKVGKK